jgi:hypothetical protein
VKCGRARASRGKWETRRKRGGRAENALGVLRKLTILVYTSKLSFLSWREGSEAGDKRIYLKTSGGQSFMRESVDISTTTREETK